VRRGENSRGAHDAAISPFGGKRCSYDDQSVVQYVSCNFVCTLLQRAQHTCRSRLQIFASASCSLQTLLLVDARESYRRSLPCAGPARMAQPTFVERKVRPCKKGNPLQRVSSSAITSLRVAVICFSVTGLAVNMAVSRRLTLCLADGGGTCTLLRRLKSQRLDTFGSHPNRIIRIASGPARVLKLV
jgi:hypothetical protein